MYLGDTVQPTRASVSPPPTPQSLPQSRPLGGRPLPADRIILGGRPWILIWLALRDPQAATHPTESWSRPGGYQDTTPEPVQGGGPRVGCGPGLSGQGDCERGGGSRSETRPPSRLAVIHVGTRQQQAPRTAGGGAAHQPPCSSQTPHSAMYRQPRPRASTGRPPPGPGGRGAGAAPVSSPDPSALPRRSPRGTCWSSSAATTRTSHACSSRGTAATSCRGARTAWCWCGASAGSAPAPTAGSASSCGACGLCPPAGEATVEGAGSHSLERPCQGPWREGLHSGQAGVRWVRAVGLFRAEGHRGRGHRDGASPLRSAPPRSVLQVDPSRTPAPRHVWSRHTLPITDLHCGLGGPLARVATASLDQTVKVGPLPPWIWQLAGSWPA